MAGEENGLIANQTRIPIYYVGIYASTVPIGFSPDDEVSR